jgi:hypothetical protein
MKADNLSETAHLRLAWVLLWTVLGVVVVFLIVSGIFLAFIAPNDGAFDGVAAFMSALALALFLVALFYQREELSLQRQELRDTRRELEGQKQQLEMQNQNATISRQEATFFRLLDNHENLTRSVVVRLNNREYVGRKAFAVLLEQLREQCSNLGPGSEVLKRMEGGIWSGHRALLDPYFFHLRELVFYFESIPKDHPNRDTLWRCLRAVLSQDEISWLGLHTFFQHNPEFQHLRYLNLLEHDSPERYIGS